MFEKKSWEIVEVCPHCGGETAVTVFHDPADYCAACNYTVLCDNCGRRMMLCDMCSHSSDYRECDWTKEHNCFRNPDYSLLLKDIPPRKRLFRVEAIEVNRMEYLIEAESEEEAKALVSGSEANDIENISYTIESVEEEWK